MIKATKNYLSINRKMVIFAWSLLLIPIIALGYFSYTAAEKETSTLIEKDLQHSVMLVNEMAEWMNTAVEKGLISREQAEESLKQIILGPKNEDGSRPINTEIDLGENGYFFVIDSSGTLLAHPNREGENLWEEQAADGTYYIQDLIQNGMDGGGFTFYEFTLPHSDKSALKVSYSYYIPEWDWIVTGGSYLQDFNGGQKQILNTIVLFAIIFSLVGGAVAYVISKRITNPLSKIAAHASEIAEGNLSLEPLKIKNNDEIGELATHFNSMQESLRKLASETRQLTNHINDSVHHLQLAITQTTDSVGQIGGELEEFSAGVQEQAAGTEQSANTMYELSNGVQQIADMASITFETASQMSENAEEGKEMIHRSIEQMNTLRSSFQTIIATVQNLIQYSTNIEEVNHNIKDIATQTQLLALNASIEAARAGEDGAGFSVVATEIRKLADQSTGFSQHISELVHSLQGTFNEVNDAVQTGEQEVQTSESVIQQTGDVFQQLLGSSRVVLTKVEETSAATEQMSAGTQEVTATIQQISQLASGFSERSESISAESQQVLTSMEQIRQQTDNLTEQAEKLSERIKQYKL